MLNPSAVTENKQRLKELDMLRAIAVLLVLGRHLLLIPETLSDGARSFFLLWREVGWIGVDLFFVISGFLVSGLLFQEYRLIGRISLSRFLIRRAFKIYPPFYVLLGVTLGFSSYFSLPTEKWLYLGEFFFLQNYVGSVWNHTWSLAVEEHFYIILSVVVCTLLSTNRGQSNPFKFLPTLIISIAVTILLFRCMTGISRPVGDWAAVLGLTHFRIDSLFFGVLLSYVVHFFPSVLESIVRRFSYILLTCVISCILIPILFPLAASRFSYTVGFTVLYLGSGALLLLALFSPSRGQARAVRFCAPALIPIGRASYSIYLWHMFMYYVSGHIFLSPASTTYSFALHVSAYLVGSVVLGMLMFRLIETPSLAIRQKLFP
jgi:peptidoglycan/LPS O-acetylase OafA/YrhL